MKKLKAKPVSQSAINDYAYTIFPGDLNASDTAFGGRILEIADRLAAIVARRHSGLLCVTLLVDSIRFIGPATQGEILIFKSAVNRVWRTSMEIGVKVLVEDVKKKKQRHVVSAYFTFVAINKKRRPILVPPVIPGTEEEKRRYAEADQRRQ